MSYGIDAIGVCASHGLLDRDDQVVLVSEETAGRVTETPRCKRCVDHLAAVKHSVRIVHLLMIACAHYLWESRGDLEKRVSLLEVGDSPPEKYRDSGLAQADEKLSRVDAEFGSGVVALQELLELD